MKKILMSLVGCGSLLLANEGYSTQSMPQAHQNQYQNMGQPGPLQYPYIPHGHPSQYQNMGQANPNLPPIACPDAGSWQLLKALDDRVFKEGRGKGGRIWDIELRSGYSEKVSDPQLHVMEGLSDAERHDLRIVEKLNQFTKNSPQEAAGGGWKYNIRYCNYKLSSQDGSLVYYVYMWLTK